MSTNHNSTVKEKPAPEVQAALRNYEVTLTGTQSLLMHHDNIDGVEAVKRWRERPENKELSVPGDDRTPPSTWIASLYTDGTNITIPFENIMRCLMEGGAGVLTGKGKKTFKAQSQSGIVIPEDMWTLMVDGKPVPYAPFVALQTEMEFSVHQSTATAHGFYLYVKRARMPGGKKHVRVRPRFDRWSARGTLTVTDSQISTAVLRDILQVAGKYKGLGDWRPSSPNSPGPFGTFSATVKEI